MSSEHGLGRRKAVFAAIAGGLGALLLSPSRAFASKWKRLDTALVEMREAKKFLKDAPDNFGGHKKKAIEALTTAIEEIENAINFAEKKR